MRGLQRCRDVVEGVGSVESRPGASLEEKSTGGKDCGGREAREAVAIGTAQSLICGFAPQKSILALVRLAMRRRRARDIQSILPAW